MMYEASPEEMQNEYARILGNQSFHAIFMKQYAEAEQLAREGLKTDSTKHWIASNLAAALLFQGKYTEAETVYRQYKSELRDSFLDDFKQFAEAGVIPKEYEADMEKIKKLLSE
jgi:predicted Zn-dependent protease